MQILTVTCSSPVLKVTLGALKKIFTIIQIAGPIILILALTMHITKLVANPDDKKTSKKIVNSIIATVLLFFIPFLVNLVMQLMGENYNVSSCWNNAIIFNIFK